MSEFQEILCSLLLWAYLFTSLYWIVACSFEDKTPKEYYLSTEGLTFLGIISKRLGALLGFLVVIGFIWMCNLFITKKIKY